MHASMQQIKRVSLAHERAWALSCALTRTLHVFSSVSYLHLFLLPWHRTSRWHNSPLTSCPCHSRCHERPGSPPRLHEKQTHTKTSIYSVASVQLSVLDIGTGAKHPRHSLFRRVFLQTRGAGSYSATSARLDARRRRSFSPKLPRATGLRPNQGGFPFLSLFFYLRRRRSSKWKYIVV